MAQQLLLLRSAAAAAGRRRALETVLAHATRDRDPVATTAAAAFRSGRRCCSIASPALMASSFSSSSSFNFRRAFTSSSSPHSAAAAAAGTSGSGTVDGEDDEVQRRATAGETSTSAASTPGTTEWRTWIESRLSELDGGEEEEGEKKEEKAAAVAAAAGAKAIEASLPAWSPTEAAEAAAATTTEAAAAAAAAAAATAAPSPPVRRALPPPRLAVVEPHAADLPSPFTGYAELGELSSSSRSASFRGGRQGSTVTEGATAAGTAPLRSPFGSSPRRPPPSASASFFSPGRLHPTRIFFPGQTYEPNELAPAASTTSSAGGGGGGSSMPFPPHFAQRRDPLPPKSALFISNAAERRPRTLVDFRDARTLQALLSETGKLPPRRRTRLSQKHHRHLMRQVKLARQLALLHPLNNKDRVDGGGAVFGDEREASAATSERASS